MTEKDICNFYLKEIFKSFLTALGCLYLATFEDTRKFACILGFLASVMMMSWIKDYRKIKKEIVEALANASESSDDDEEELDYEEDLEDEDEEYLE